MFKLNSQYFLCVAIKCRLMPHKSERCGSAAPVPCANLLIPQGEHLLHGRDPSASKAFIVLAHFDGLQPLRHWPEHVAVTAAGAGQADGHSVWNNVGSDESSFTATLCTTNVCDDNIQWPSFGYVVTKKTNKLCTHRGSKSAMVVSDSGLWSSLSKMLTISEKRGRLERSCCQHWSMSW